jgi:hypothetical protein
MTDPWTTDGAWLRCALHAHTTQSDGELAPRHLARHYERAGYDVLAITDHWRITDAVSKERHAGRELECDANGLVVHARLDVPPSARHVRIEAADAAGRKAWANPFPV